MASSSPLSEPPSSPPRTPSRDRLRKRGSFDPSTPRMARRLRSASREETPRTTRSPGREASKGKGRGVATPLTKEEARERAKDRMRAHFANMRVGGPGLFDDDDNSDDDDDNIGDLYEDCSESEAVSLTPGEKYTGPSTSGGEKTLRSVDQQWSAMESEDSQRALLAKME